MQDIINSFKAHLYERTSSPLVGSFIFYWLICNYKLIIVLFSDLQPNEKFMEIADLYPQKTITLWQGFEIHYLTLLGNGFLIPLILTLIYIFLVPKPALFIYGIWKKNQKEILEVKQKIDDETPLTKEESRKIKQDFYNLQNQYYDLLKHNDNLQKNSFDGKQNNPTEESWTDNIVHTKPKITDKILTNDSIPITHKILYIVGKSRSYSTSSHIGTELNLHPARVDKETVDLINKGYIRIDKKMSSQGENPYHITEEGKNFLVEKEYV